MSNDSPSRTFEVTGTLADIHKRSLTPSRIQVRDGVIHSITPTGDPAEGPFIIPGLVDAHVHVESSMLVPTEFARMAMKQGTVASVSDPHEIANVLGMQGVLFMIENGKKSPFKFNFGAPSCVPATTFETAGAVLNADDVAQLLQMEEIGYLTEVMNYPGVLQQDPELLRKIETAKALGKPVDGHAPGLRGEDAARYAAAGISTEHECVTLEEALDKLSCGMKILIREGSAAQNFEALWTLLNTHPESVMFCSDDKHPDDLMRGHINELIARAIAKGVDLFDALRAASINVVEHYRMPVGLLRKGDPADFVLVEDLKDFRVLSTYIDGQLCAEAGTDPVAHHTIQTPNKFERLPLSEDNFSIEISGPNVQVITVEDQQIVTGSDSILHQQTGFFEADCKRDLLKLAVINRYDSNTTPALAVVKNFGLKAGALASTVAHDSHNIIAVGCSDEALALAVNQVIDCKGGIAVCTEEGKTACLPLPVAGLMTTEDGWETARAYEQLDAAAKELGCTLKAPFMTLSFLALLVIPSLKLSDKGLFDGNKFSFTPLFSTP